MYYHLHYQVLVFLNENEMYLFILYPDTSGGTQTHDQCNGRLHALYDEKKEQLYSTIAVLNREAFMTILSECWEEFLTRDRLLAASKRVGITSSGLNINWMNQEMFKRADYLLNGPPEVFSPAEPSSNISPTVRRNSLEWFKQENARLLAENNQLKNTPVRLEDVEGLLPLTKIQPKKSKHVRITQEHGSLRAKDLLAKVCTYVLYKLCQSVRPCA